jgi:hypothetical protein
MGFEIRLETRRVHAGAAASFHALSDVSEDVVELHRVGEDALLPRIRPGCILHLGDVIRRPRAGKMRSSRDPVPPVRQQDQRAQRLRLAMTSK